MTNPTPLSTLLAELDALQAEANSRTDDIVRDMMRDTFAIRLREAYPQLREALREKDEEYLDARQAIEIYKRELDKMHTLRTLVEQQRGEIWNLVDRNFQQRELVAQQQEALRGFVDAFKLDWSGHALGELIAKARAVLATEVPGE